MNMQTTIKMAVLAFVLFVMQCFALRGIERVSKERVDFGVEVRSEVAAANQAAPGQFFRAPGGTTLTDGDKRVSIDISTVADADGQLSPTVTWRSGNITQSSSMNSHRWKPKRWFVFVESSSRIWMFDGNDGLRVLLITEKNTSNSDTAEDLKTCPKEVREALPEAVRKRYFK